MLLEHRKMELIGLIDKMRLPERRSWILMVPNGVGETAIVCGFAKGFVEQHGHGITLVTRDMFVPLAAMYLGRFNTVMTAPFELMRDFSNFGIIPPNHFDVDFPFNTWAAQYGDGRYYKINELYVQHGHARGGLSLTDLFRHILRLNWNTPIERPVIQEETKIKAAEIANRHGIIRGKSVILFPGNGSTTPAPYLFWEAISELFRKKRGFKIFANCRGAGILPNQMPKLDSDQLDLPVDLALAVSELAGHIVIGGNGFALLALLANIQCKVNIILPKSVIHNNPGEGEREVSIMHSSTRFNIPELFSQDNFSEWLTPPEESPALFQTLALDIVEDRPSDSRLTPEMISDFMFHNHSEWAKKLIC